LAERVAVEDLVKLAILLGSGELSLERKREILASFVAAARKSIDSWIERYVESRFPQPLAGRVLYAVMGGKRLRGSLLILYAYMEGADEAPLDLAAAVEMAHSASLVHDDIADSSETRRGRPSFWAKFGLHEAVTVPHILIPEALSIIGRRGENMLLKSIEGWRLAAKGQYYDLLVKSSEIDVDYEELVRLKSGAVFATACYIGSSVAKGDAETAYEFGMRLGIAYQALDDATAIVQDSVDSGSALLALNLWGERAVDELVETARKELREGLVLLEPSLRDVLAVFALKTVEDISREGGNAFYDMVRRSLVHVVSY